MSLAKLLRQYLAERPRAAFTADQLVRLLHSAGLTDTEPAPDAVFAGLKTLDKQGHVSVRKDPDNDAFLYQITHDGNAKYRASP